MSSDVWDDHRGGCEDDDTSSDAASMYRAPGGAMTLLDAVDFLSFATSKILGMTWDDYG